MTNVDDLTILEQTERYVGYALDCARTPTGTTDAAGTAGAGRALRIAGRLYMPAELLAIPGAGHGFSGTDFTTACNAAATFMFNATALAA